MPATKKSVLLLLFVLPTSFYLNGQDKLQTIACICELEALMLKSKISSEELILEETENGFAYSFVPKAPPIPEPIPEIEEEEEEEEEEIISEQIETKVKSSSRSRKLNKKKSNTAKRKKRKRKKLKKRKFKKYKGDCPVW